MSTVFVPFGREDIVVPGSHSPVPEVRDWLIQMIGPYYSNWMVFSALTCSKDRGWTRTNDVHRDGMVFHFLRDTDAVLFKLRWL